MSDLFSGTYVELPTPFDDSGDLDLQTFKSYCNNFKDKNLDGLVVLSPTGESATLSNNEKFEVIEKAVSEIDKPVIAGTGSNSTRETISISEQAVDIGVDGLLLVSPYYNLPEREGLEEHFYSVADEVDAPQIIYNVPGRTGTDIPVESVVSLSKHNNIVGYKAASANLENIGRVSTQTDAGHADLDKISEIISKTMDENFEILSGDDAITLPVLSIGGTGAMSISANIYPNEINNMVSHANDNNYSEAREIHQRLGDFFRVMYQETNPIPVKEAMNIVYGYPNNVRLPLSPASDQLRSKLQEMLE